MGAFLLSGRRSKANKADLKDIIYPVRMIILSRKITALLLLSTKYDFKDIRMDVMNHLLRHYPPSLSEFVAVDDDGARSFKGHRWTHHFRLLEVALVAEAE